MAPEFPLYFGGPPSPVIFSLENAMPGKSRSKSRPIQPINNRQKKTGNPASYPDQIIAAALTVFKRLGVARTRLEDIAIEAGISRPLLYQYFANRTALLDAAIVKKIEHHLELQKRNMPKNAGFVTSVVEGAVIALELARQDTVMLDLFEHSSVQHLPELLLNPEMPVHAFFLELWQPIFDKARKNGELRSTLKDDDILEWLLSVNYMFGLRDDVSDDRLRELFRLFVIPALVTNS